MSLRNLARLKSLPVDFVFIGLIFSENTGSYDAACCYSNSPIPGVTLPETKRCFKGSKSGVRNAGMLRGTGDCDGSIMIFDWERVGFSIELL
jgi:hypothetical protein